MICVVIGRTRHKMIQAEIQHAAKQGARMIELRLDFLAKAPDFKRLLANRPCELVATVRRPQDGGRWSGTEPERETLIRQAIVSGFDWIDLETDVADEIRRYKNVKRIVSYHNMREVPADLEQIHERMCNQDADVVKLAVRGQDPADNLRVLDLVKKPAKPTVAHCMGDLGLPSRILGGKFGVPFSYAAFNKERGIAPGLPSFEEMKNVFHRSRTASVRSFTMRHSIACGSMRFISRFAFRAATSKGLSRSTNAYRSAAIALLSRTRKMPPHWRSTKTHRSC
jgi:3-dehydroquinate dehydratase/shikimate dehydrogenase